MTTPAAASRRCRWNCLWNRRGLSNRCAPSPAWPGPAKQDFYHYHYDLRPLETYDHAFHATVREARSTSAPPPRTRSTRWMRQRTDSLDLLHGRAGSLRPGALGRPGLCRLGRRVRLLPVRRRRRAVWKKRIAPEERMVPGNGRIISLWPIRTGLVVDEGTVYCTAGLFPEDGTYLAALEAQTGDVKYRQRILVSPQGYMLASAQRLYLPTGRTNPAIFTRAEGKADGQLPARAAPTRCWSRTCSSAARDGARRSCRPAISGRRTPLRRSAVCGWWFRVHGLYAVGAAGVGVRSRTLS